MGQKELPEEHHHNRIKSPWTIYGMCLNASLGIFFFGFNQGVFNVVQLIILELKGYTDDSDKSLYSALMTSFNPLGGLIGALTGTYILKCCGGLKKSFFLADFIGIIGTVIILSKIDILNIVIGRFFQGFAQGINAALVPLYIKEFSPLEISGKTGSFPQLGQKGGLLMAYLFGLVLPSKHKIKEDDFDYDNEYEWRFVIAVPILFCVIRSLMLLTCFRQDTPTNMLKHHHEGELKRFLHMLYKDQDFDDAYSKAVQKYHMKELHDLHELQAQQKLEGKPITQGIHTENDHDLHHEDEDHQDNEKQQKEQIIAVKQDDIDIKIRGMSGEIQSKQPHAQLNDQDQDQIGSGNELTESQIEREEEEFERIEKASKSRRNLVGWMISLTVSLSGIDAIFFYSNKIFEDNGMEEYAIYATIGIGVSAILFSFIGMETVDHAGRRPLLIGGSSIMTLSLVGLVLGDLTDQVGLIVGAIIVFMFGYNSTLGPIKWPCYVELMDQFGVSVAAALIFVMAFIIALVFPFMVDWINLYGAFSIFLGLSVCCTLFLYFNFIETKGLTQRQIYPMYVKGYKPIPKEVPHHQNTHILELHGAAQIHLSGAVGNKKVSMATIQKSFHKSLVSDKLKKK